MRWKKKNGNEFETNDDQATINYCESQGMVRLDEPEESDAPKPLTEEQVLAEAQKLVDEGKQEEADALLAKHEKPAAT